VASKAGISVGAIEIPVDATDPAYPIYKSSAEFASGNLDAAWSLYVGHVDQLPPLIRKLPNEYSLWLLGETIAAERTTEAETIIKAVTLWSREAPGLLTPEQEARLKIAYADVQLLRGALATARAWYRRVADAAEFRGTEMHLLAGLGSARVDRVTKNFSAALTELDKLVALSNPAFTLPIRYARAEVLMDQENYKEALDEITAVLRQEPKHPDALILQGRIHTEMRKLIEASEIELGPSQTDTVLVPGEPVKINLRDPTLGVSGVTAEIEVEVRAKSGDRELVMLAPLGDSRDKFRPRRRATRRSRSSAATRSASAIRPAFGPRCGTCLPTPTSRSAWPPTRGSASRPAAFRPSPASGGSPSRNSGSRRPRPSLASGPSGRAIPSTSA